MELGPKTLLIGIGINAGLNAFITFFTFRGGVGDYNRVLDMDIRKLVGCRLELCQSDYSNSFINVYSSIIES